MSRWRFTFAAIMVTALTALAVAQGQDKGKPQVEQVKLWAVISVPQPIFYGRETNALQIGFGVFNDGRSPMNPTIDSSHLFINGVELKDWLFIVTNGPRTSSFSSLPPGQFLRFSAVLGKYFQKPGAYTVRWECETFKATEITFRVLPGDL
jgi:archaellum component FlaG (FlaF/FlaG flagellin family)